MSWRGRAVLLLAAAGVLAAAARGAAQEPEGLAALRARGDVRVCADPSNLPYSSDDPALPGFEVELARRVAGELGLEARFVWHLTWVRALRPFREGACELFMGLPTDPRFLQGHPWVVVSRPYYVMGHALVVTREQAVSRLADLVGQRVAVEAASVADLWLAQANVRRGLYRRQAETVEAVARGEAAAAVLWWPVASWLTRTRPQLRLIPLPDPALNFPIGAGVRRRQAELALAVDAALARLEAGGRTQELLLRWGAIPPRGAAAPPAAVALAGSDDPVERGRSLFATMCSRCHGAEGVGGGLGGLVPVIRQYQGGAEKFVRVVREGRRGTPMAPFRGILTDEEILSIYRYLTSRPAS